MHIAHPSKVSEWCHLSLTYWNCTNSDLFWSSSLLFIATKKTSWWLHSLRRWHRHFLFIIIPSLSRDIYSSKKRPHINKLLNRLRQRGAACQPASYVARMLSLSLSLSLLSVDCLRSNIIARSPFLHWLTFWLEWTSIASGCPISNTYLFTRILIEKEGKFASVCGLFWFMTARVIFSLRNAIRQI